MGPTPQRAMRARSQRPDASSVTSAATPTRAKSPARRAISTKAPPVRRGWSGTRTSTSSSPGSSAVVSGPTKNVGRGTVRRGLLAGEGELRLERDHHGGQLGGGIGVGEAAADGAAVANRRVADEAARLGEDGRARPHRLRPLHRVLAGERADRQAVVGRADIREVADAVDVDQRLGMGEPEVEEGDQALAAGQDLGPVTRGWASRASASSTARGA